MSFHNDGQIGHSHDAVKAILRAYGISEFTFSVADSGIENTTFIVVTPQEQYALRVYRHSKKQDGEIERELAFMDALRAQGMPIPVVLPNTKGEQISTVSFDDKTWEALLCEYVEGVHPTAYTETLICRMADLQAQMHSLGAAFDSDNAPTRHLKHLAEAEFVKRIDIARLRSTDLQQLIERISDYQISIDPALPYGYSHFDFDAGNILVDARGELSAILDFDDLQYGPLVVCLGYTLYDILQETSSVELVRAYIARYNKTRKLTPNELAWLPITMLFRHYVMVALRVLNDRTDPYDVQKYLALEKQLMTLDLSD